MRLSILVAILVLGGCATPRPTAQQIATSDDAQCQSYGAKPGTDAYVQCRTSIAQQRAQGQAAMAAAILSKPSPQPYVLPQPQASPQPYMLPPVSNNPRVNCTSTPVGNSVQTTCQ